MLHIGRRGEMKGWCQQYRRTGESEESEESEEAEEAEEAEKAGRRRERRRRPWMVRRRASFSSRLGIRKIRNLGTRGTLGTGEKSHIFSSCSRQKDEKLKKKGVKTK